MFQQTVHNMTTRDGFYEQYLPTTSVDSRAVGGLRDRGSVENVTL